MGIKQTKKAANHASKPFDFIGLIDQKILLQNFVMFCVHLCLGNQLRLLQEIDIVKVRNGYLNRKLHLFFCFYKLSRISMKS